MKVPPCFFLFVCRLESEVKLSVILCCHPSFPEFCALVTSSLDQDSGPWVVSKISHFGTTVSCSWFADVILCSLVCSAEPNVISWLLILSGYLSGYFITTWLNQIILSKCENFPYFVMVAERKIVSRSRFTDGFGESCSSW